jgi:RimJ/RimL family protein N-acetyltransferase
VTSFAETDAWDPPVLAGRLVVLRRHRAEDLGPILRWYADPEVARLTRYSVRPMTDEEVRRYFETRLLSPGALAYGIHERGTDRLIGLTTFSSLDPENGSVLFHITIGEHDRWGHGYGTEATELMLRLAFERFGLHRVGLSVFSFNERAIRSYTKAGFVVEGRLRDAIARDGRWWDEVQMGILRDEWLAAHAMPARTGG